jgi:hypothetical protein
MHPRGVPIHHNAVGGANGFPHLLLHGSSPSLVDQIRDEGLAPSEAAANWNWFLPVRRLGSAVGAQGLNTMQPKGVYLTDFLALARHVVWVRSSPYNDWDPRGIENYIDVQEEYLEDEGVIVVDVRGLRLISADGWEVLSLSRIEPGRICGTYDELRHHDLVDHRGIMKVGIDNPSSLPR